MTEGSGVSSRLEPIDLARQADFALASATIRPSLSEVLAGGQTIRLQPRVMQVLVALVRAGGEVVSRDDLVASCWGGLAIGDDAINRCIGRLRRLAEDEAPGSFTIETLPRIGYRLSRSGDEPSAIGASDTRRSGRRLALVALALTAAALVVGGAWLALGRPGLTPRPSGVAVMPFETASGDPLSRAFAEGVADEVASTLTSSDLRSIKSDTGPGSSGLQRDAAAGRLGAAFALGGRVRRDGDLLRVSVSLSDVAGHDVLWSADVSRPASEAQDLQEQVAVKVADVLHCTLDANTFGGRIPRESLRLYLHACEAMDSEGADEVRDRFRQVVAREPRLANAWGTLALASAMASGDLPPDLAIEARREARSAAFRALRLDPKAGVADVALSTLMEPAHLWERQKLLLAGLKFSPDNALLNFIEAELLGQAGRTREAIAFERRAVRLNPLLHDFTTELARALASAADISEARALMEHATRIWPDSDDVKESRIAMEARFGDPTRALALIADVKTRPSDWESPMIEKWRRFALTRQDPSPLTVAAYAREVLTRLAAGRQDVGSAVRELVGVGATVGTRAFAAAARSSPADPRHRSAVPAVRRGYAMRDTPAVHATGGRGWASSISGGAPAIGPISVSPPTGPTTARAVAARLASRS